MQVRRIGANGGLSGAGAEQCREKERMGLGRSVHTMEAYPWLRGKFFPYPEESSGTSLLQDA